jgi:hypothetical protein
MCGCGCIVVVRPISNLLLSRKVALQCRKKLHDAAKLCTLYTMCHLPHTSPQYMLHLLLRITASVVIWANPTPCLARWHPQVKGYLSV